MVLTEMKNAPLRSEGSALGKMIMIAPRSNNRRSRIPHLFERSSGKWWNPQMDSAILEKQCMECSLEQSKSYFQLALCFVVLASLSWIIYYAANRLLDAWVAGLSWSIGLIVFCIVVLVLTTRPRNFYKKFSCYIAIGVAVVLMITVFVAAYFEKTIMTEVGSFFLAAEVILLLYTVMPLPLHINCIMGVAFSVAFEIFSHLGSGDSEWNIILGRCFLHLCIHLLGVQICINLQVRRRSTFWKVGQIIQSSLSLKVEAKFKKLMINSIMPPSIAEDLIGKEGKESIFQTTDRDSSKFRPLYVNRMENVSILYADIVGFTKMSTNKSAATLVYLLNDLFGRFDKLCIESGCEKISTLGDCYYCVAGCPVANPDHAKCCVEMGLGMISAIKDFCADNDLNVDMRIGIHTGTVICGIVGTQRFKFDVWSNDVSFANQMEQWGVPGRIHVSESTKEALGDLYDFEDGLIHERAPMNIVEEKNLKTYLIVKRANPQRLVASVENGKESRQLTDEENNKVSIKDETAVFSNGINSDSTQQEIKPVVREFRDAEETRDSTTSLRVSDAPAKQPVQDRPSNGTCEPDNSSPTDPLLLVQNQILELIGLHGMLPMLNPGESVVRMEQDKEFVASIKDDDRMKNINNNQALESLSMRFKKPEIEEGYRNNFTFEVEKDEPITSFVSTRFSFFLDLLISFIVFFFVFLASFLSFGWQVDNVAWIVFFCLCFFLQLFIVAISGIYVFHVETASPWVKSLITKFSGWIPRHILGAISLLFPAGVMFSHMWCRSSDQPSCTHYLIVASVVVIQFLNFNQLSSWLRSIIASLIAIIVTVLVYVNPCSGSSSVSKLCEEVNDEFHYEFILDVILLLIFIAIVNKEYEIGHRLTYFSALEAEQSNKKMETERNQIDRLLHHIIPPHVEEVIRESGSYSQNHENVGVIFASITNFNVFYEETYKGGMQCIRVLNEIIGDVDQKLDEKEFADVEKIKTIGSTFMIASGLNPQTIRGPDDNSHLVTLMDFCMEMQDVLYAFNESMVYFTFILRIGFNHGSVTAGVIGTTKLLYDIWGDTVNIASRMDSTGEPCKVQVSDKSMRSLAPHYDFMERGTIFVKGKGNMKTYLLVRPGDENRPEPIVEPERTPINFVGQIT